jgi:hypothetical protein
MELRLDTADTESNNIVGMSDKNHNNLKYEYQPFIMSSFDSNTNSND